MHDALQDFGNDAKMNGRIKSQCPHLTIFFARWILSWTLLNFSELKTKASSSDTSRIGGRTTRRRGRDERSYRRSNNWKSLVLRTWQKSRKRFQLHMSWWDYETMDVPWFSRAKGIGQSTLTIYARLCDLCRKRHFLSVFGKSIIKEKTKHLETPTQQLSVYVPYP